MNDAGKDPAAIAKPIREFIVENFLFGRDAGFANDQSFIAMGILDSTGVLELVNFVEQSFGLTIEDHELTPDNMDSIDSLVAFIRGKL